MINILSCSDLGINIYKPIISDDLRYHYLFEESYQDSLSCEYSFGNENEKLFAYTLSGDYKIIVWEFGGLKGVPIDSIKLLNEKPDFIDSSLPTSGVEYGNPNLVIRKSIDTLNGAGINIYKSQLSNLSVVDSDSSRMILKGTVNKFLISNISKTRWIDFKYLDGIVLTEIIFIKQIDSLIIMVINPMKDKTDIDDSFLPHSSYLRNVVANKIPRIKQYNFNNN